MINLQISHVRMSLIFQVPVDHASALLVSRDNESQLKASVAKQDGLCVMNRGQENTLACAGFLF